MSDDVRYWIFGECDSVIENWIASFVSFLLSVVGVSSVTEGTIIYVPSLDHRFVVTLSCVDLVGVSLWGFMYVFLVWVYINLEGRPMTRRKYGALGVVGFVAFFLANILRMFVEIFYLSSMGAGYVNILSQWQAFEEQVGIGLMFATFSILLLGSYGMLRKLPRITPVDLRSSGLKGTVSN